MLNKITEIDEPRVGKFAGGYELGRSAVKVIAPPAPARRLIHYPHGEELISHSWYLDFKRAFDIALAATLLVLLAPVIAVMALLVKVTSPGKAFYTQTRMGRFGHPFQILKLRTMRQNAEGKCGPVWAKPGDSRVTLVGKFLRKTHLDELPQLWNVLHGEMSMVGPRPERPEFLPMLEAKLPDYRQRLLVRPGVTGLAQVYLPPDTDIDSVKKKLVYDLHYVKGFTIFHDVRLMIATAVQAAGIPHAFVRRVLWLERNDKIESQD